MIITINGTEYTPTLVEDIYELSLSLEYAKIYPITVSYWDEWEDYYEETIDIVVLPYYFDLEELKKRCVAQGFNYAYGVFKTPQEPPFLVAKGNDSTNFIADNLVYKKKTPIQMDYIFVDKDMTDQEKIENIILGDIPWEKSSEVYLSDEKVWQVSYFFELIGG